MVILSLGGDSSLSEGYYIKKNHGSEFEVGVMKGNSVWRSKFHLLFEPSWTQLAFTWSQSRGVAAYVDGLLVGQNLQASTRKFLATEFRYFPQITVGSTKLHYALKKLVIYGQELTKEKLYSNLGLCCFFLSLKVFMGLRLMKISKLNSDVCAF